MRLTLHTDYALRMLIYLAVHDGKPATVSDVATIYGLSRNHLLKIALKLGRFGYLRTTRGRSGGISLVQPPEMINIGDVVRAMEDDFALVECLRPDGGRCLISPACRLKGLVREAAGAFLAVFDSYTLADLVANRQLLEQFVKPPRDSVELA